MTFVILEIDSGNGNARSIEAWDWNTLIEPDVGDVKVNAFDTAEQLEAAIVRTVNRVSDRELREQNEADRRLIRDSASGESDVLDEYASHVSVKAELPGSGLSVELWYGEADGVPVVQIDGPSDEFTDADGNPGIRVWINDGLTYDGSPS